jgi:gas vesicle protein
MDENDYAEHYDEMHTTSGAGGFLAGLLIGALAGAAAMLLLAPQSGEDARTKLREKADSTLEGVRERARGLTSEVKDKLSEAQLKSHDVLEEQRNRVAEAVAAGRDRLRRR